MDPQGDFVTVPNMTSATGAPVFMNRYYSIEKEIDGELKWFEICRCDSAESVASILHALLRAPKYPPKALKITVIDG